MEDWGMWTLNDCKPELWSYQDMWWEGTDYEPIQQYEGQEPRIKWAVLGRAGLCPSWRDHHDRGLGSLVGGISVRSRVGCWHTITVCVTTKLTVKDGNICSVIVV